MEHTLRGWSLCWGRSPLVPSGYRGGGGVGGGHTSLETPPPGAAPSEWPPLFLCPGGLPHSQQRKKLLPFFSSLLLTLASSGPPSPPSHAMSCQGYFFSCPPPAGWDSLRSGILRGEDRRRREKSSSCLSVWNLACCLSNNAVSISWCILMSCMPDPLGKGGKGAKLWVRPATVQLSPPLVGLYSPESCCHPRPVYHLMASSPSSRSSVSYYHSLMKPPKSVNSLFLILSIIT